MPELVSSMSNNPEPFQGEVTAANYEAVPLSLVEEALRTKKNLRLKMLRFDGFCTVEITVIVPNVNDGFAFSCRDSDGRLWHAQATQRVTTFSG